MKIGLIDVDGHNFPNLALMRISAYHKSKGDDVEWWWTELEHYDVIYMSKAFSAEYSKDAHTPMNCGKVIKGGTGYCISLKNGKEVFSKSNNTLLPPEIERMFPDYSIYPQYDFAISMTSRGCPNNCAFCHVTAKEGNCSVKVADVSDFWNGQKEIKVLDPNITACKDRDADFSKCKSSRYKFSGRSELSMEKLKPCPFCGGKAVFFAESNRSSHTDVGFEFSIKCTVCNVKSPFKYAVSFHLNENGEIHPTTDKRNKAIEEWNRRVDND